MTLQQIIDAGADRFVSAGICFGHGTDNAWDEAAWLAASVIGLPLPLNDTDLRMTASAAQQQSIEELYARRIKSRLPAAYLLNEAWFCGLPFYVDQRVLVPRSPLAELILDGFAPWIDSQQISRILDIGTGSGCIAVACAVHLPRAIVVASDISEAALEVARINIERHELQQRVNLRHSDLFAELSAEPPFDVIISNPPYVSTGRSGTLPAEYKHEPQLGLYSGESGLDHASSILEQAHAHLSARGILVLEVGESQTALARRFPQLEFNWVEFAHGGEGVCILEKQQLSRLSSE